MKKKVVALVLVCVLVFGIAVGGTLAWLIDSTKTVKNVFTVGDINIKLTENDVDISTTQDETRDFKIVPGVDLKKDAVVTVLNGSEDCYVFVKVTEEYRKVNDTTKNYFDYQMDDAWTLVAGETDVYYQEVKNISADVPLAILKAYAHGKQVDVNDNLTKAELNELGDSKPSLSFKAYAVQMAGMADAADAWEAATANA